MRRFWLLLLVLVLMGVPVCAQTASTVTWTNVHQTITGFGASNHQTSMGSTYDTLFFRTLGYSLLRTGTPETNNVCNTISANCATNADPIADQLACVANGCQVWATSWSAPANYKTNNNIACCPNPGQGTGCKDTSVGNGGALAASSQAAFATFLSNYIASLKQFESINLYAISVQNEPEVCQQYDSALMPGTQFTSFITNNLAPTLNSASQTTLIAMPETSGTPSSPFGDFATYSNDCLVTHASTCKPLVGLNTFHAYGYGPTANGPANPNNGISLWETETSSSNGSPPNNYGPTAPGCTVGVWCNTISDAIMQAGIVDYQLANSNVSAWLYWKYVSSFGDNEGLVDTTENPQISIRAYAIAQWAKYVRPGWVRIDATHNPNTGIAITAFRDTAQQNFAVVLVNSNTSGSVNQPVNFTGAPTFTTVSATRTSSTQSIASITAPTVSSNSFTINLPAQTITTVFGAISGGGGANACPSGNPQYWDPKSETLKALSFWGITKCIYVSSAGSDSNTGADEQHPLLNAPWMPNCTTGGCAAARTAFTAGEGIIVQGGSHYHMGNSGATAYTGGSWNFNVTPIPQATNSAWIYVGVDNGWTLNGPVWTRPILDGDNPITNAGSLPSPTGNPVASCPFQIPGNNVIIAANGPSLTYRIYDNFEMYGVCNSHLGSLSGNNYGSEIAAGNGSSGATHGGPIYIFHNYIHGWSHMPYPQYNNGISNCTATTICAGIAAITAGTFNNADGGDVVEWNVIDGSDSDMYGQDVSGPSGTAGFLYAYNRFNYVNLTIFGGGIYHDNVISNYADKGHDDLMFAEGALVNPAAFNNNFLCHWPEPANLAPTTVGIWPNTGTGENYYLFNNVSCDVNGVSYINVGSTVNITAGGNIISFNNTWQSNNNQFIWRNCSPSNRPATNSTTQNDFYINDALSGSLQIPTTTTNPAGCATGYTATVTNPLYQTNAQAASNYASSSSQFPLAPTNSSAPTETAPSTSIAAYCTAMQNAVNGGAWQLTRSASECLQDATYGVSYNTSNHTLSWPARTPLNRNTAVPKVGAVEFSNAPTANIIITSNPTACGSVVVGGAANCPSILVTNNGTASATITGVTLGDTVDYTITSNPCGVLAANANCSVSVSFAPQSGGSLNTTLTVTSTAPNSPAQASLTGTGLVPAFTVTPNPVNFGSVPLNTPSSQITVTLQNTGTAPGTLSNTSYFTIQNNDYKNVGGSCALGQVLAVNATCTNNIQVTPTVFGNDSGLFTYNGANGLGQAVNASTSLVAQGTGSGNEVCQPSPSYNFGGLIISQTSPGQQFYCTNNGTLALTINTITFTGPFSLALGGQPSNFCTGSQAAGQSCAFIVVYQPTLVQADSGSVVLTNTGGPNLTINLSGNGLPIPPPNPNPPSGAVF